MEELENEVEEGERRLRDIGTECEESVVYRGFSKVYIPNKIEFEAHCRTYVPYRSWCSICVQAKKRNPPHVTAKMGDHRETPEISMDNTFLNYKHGADNNPVLIVTDSQSGGLWVLPVVRKGNYNSYISIASVLDKIGYAKCILKSDQEYSINEVAEETRRVLQEELRKCADQVTLDEPCKGMVIEPQIGLESSLVGESQSNGRVENAIQRIQGQIRALKLDIESRSNISLTSQRAIWLWLIEHAAQCLHMYQTGRGDGLMPYQRIRGRVAMTRSVRFGEKVLYKPSKTVKMDKTEARWKYGLWLGITEHTCEHIIFVWPGEV